MSRQALRAIASFALCANLFLAMGSAANASGSSPAFNFYLTYLERTAMADGVDDIAVFMPAWWNQRMRSSSVEDQAAAVERIRKSSQALEEVALEGEEPVDSGVRLHMTARSNDLPMRGTVLLSTESGAFKVEESSWLSGESVRN